MLEELSPGKDPKLISKERERKALYLPILLGQARNVSLNNQMSHSVV